MRRHGLYQLALVAYATRVHASPFSWLRQVSTTSFQDQSWLWGWAWGGDNSVTIVDRSPPLAFLSRPAGFGAELNDPLLGYVIPLNAFTAPCPDNSSYISTTDWIVEPNVGCPSLCPVGGNVPDSAEPWIALVQRGDCQFVDKAREAQRLGAKALVVGGDDPQLSGNADVLVGMFSPADASDVTIAATFIRYSDYMELYALIIASNTSHAGLKTLSLLISSDYSWAWYSPIITFFSILFIPSSLTFLTLLVHRIRAARAAQRDRAPEDVVKNLPWRVWTGSGWEKHEGAVPEVVSFDTTTPGDLTVDLEAGEGPGPIPPAQTTSAAAADDDEDPVWFMSQVECVICLENFARGDRVRVLPCKHIFHLDEVDDWLIHRKKLCPVCKADVTHPRPPVPHNEDSSVPTPELQSTPPAPASPPSEPTERTPLLPLPAPALADTRAPS
ncbi:hypothetical protein FA95DRAFT_1504251 [Auriscalpium vulgare]|uniref:Uncharacterized protein n=1 Tax=Auriscalpium vulgare TaxID=40419 RepID=A0ACB8R5Q5_9AGAM|nr:hypothetical protein FA95DRAFT_1504251 [Auriscalpium vulgare]